MPNHGETKSEAGASGGVFHVFNIEKAQALALAKALAGEGASAEAARAQPVMGGPISGTMCKTSGPTLHPNDFNCGDSDPG
jgi:hypothetical protein